MSVRPIAFAADGGITVLHDDLGHTGAVAFADMRFGRGPDGAVDPDFLVIACPVCGAVSVHPIGGGCDPVRVQLLFARIYSRRRAALGIPTGATWQQIKDRVRTRVEAMDGPRRWRLDNATTEDTIPNDNGAA